MRDKTSQLAALSSTKNGEHANCNQLLDCDLVMKGGITSGVVYPKAVVRLAQRYRIRSVGGTSVGAIAAVLTAAAEYYRQTDHDGNAQQWPQLRARMDADLGRPPEACHAAHSANDVRSNQLPGFAGLYTIPSEVGGTLLEKFQPQWWTRGAFNYLIGIMQWKNFVGKLVAALVDGFLVIRTLTALLSCLIAVSLVRDSDTAISLAVFAVAMIGVLVAARLVLLVWPQSRPGRIRAGRNRRAARFGVSVAFILMSFGLSLAVRDLFDITGASLTVGDFFAPIPEIWNQFPDVQQELRHGTQEKQAWIGSAVIGLLFGWIAGGGVALAIYLGFLVPRNYLGLCTGLGTPTALTNWLTTKIDLVAGLSAVQGSGPLTCGMLEDRDITLEAIASDLTRGVPLDLPHALVNYGFKPSEFRKFFPDPVLRQLGVGSESEDDIGIRPFPAPKDIPVVVVARMSMSFPVLFSAVPIYYRPTSGRPSWLSDGGIVSNFPVHKFDRALPPWPTFAFDLIQKRGYPPEDSDGLVSLAPIESPKVQSSNATADLRVHDVSIKDLIGLLSGLLNTARGWMDNSQKTLPGYAERIVGIHLYPGEGGLNLTMDETAIVRLANRGLVGADLLAKQWDPFCATGEPNQASQWHQHRWLRYRILMRELEELAREWTWVYQPAAPNIVPVHQPSLAALVAATGSGDDEPRAYTYRWQTRDSSTLAKRVTETFVAFAGVATGPGCEVHQEATTGGKAVLNPIIFDQEHRPTPDPKLFMIPPFE